MHLAIVKKPKNDKMLDILDILCWFRFKIDRCYPNWSHTQFCARFHLFRLVGLGVQVCFFIFIGKFVRVFFFLLYRHFFCSSQSHWNMCMFSVSLVLLRLHGVLIINSGAISLPSEEPFSISTCECWYWYVHTCFISLGLSLLLLLLLLIILLLLPLLLSHCLHFCVH